MGFLGEKGKLLDAIELLERDIHAVGIGVGEGVDGHINLQGGRRTRMCVLKIDIDVDICKVCDEASSVWVKAGGTGDEDRVGEVLIIQSS